jgi:hypothetical protein
MLNGLISICKVAEKGGDVSSEKRTGLHVRNYECLAMLLRNMNKIHINEEWVVLFGGTGSCKSPRIVCVAVGA